MAVEGLTARLGTVRLLTTVLQEGAMLNQLVADPTGPLVGMSADDAARARRLCLTVLRQLERADAVLQPLMRKAPPLFILNVLRLAVVELDGGAAPHGVVHVAVECARSDRRAAHFAGLVNAVLRKVPPGPILQAMPVPKLPRWLRQPVVHAYGREAVAGIETVQAVAPPIDITFKAGAVEKPDGVDLPNGSRRLKDFSQVGTGRGSGDGGAVVGPKGGGAGAGHLCRTGWQDAAAGGCGGRRDGAGYLGPSCGAVAREPFADGDGGGSCDC